MEKKLGVKFLFLTFNFRLSENFLLQIIFVLFGGCSLIEKFNQSIFQEMRLKKFKRMLYKLGDT
jgi:hypothetical protein